MAYLNNKLWKSAYLLEFMKGESLKDAFAFSVPPQSEEFTFAQRLNETKTFGGSVFDDYGNDTVKISLSGTTINQELKIIYCSSKGKKYLSGQDEIFYLRDLLEKYGKFENLQDKKVYLYALDSGKKNKGGKNQKAWRVFINELQIKRSKDSPFTYYYTMNMTGVPIEVENRLLSKLKGVKDIETALGALKEVQDTFNGYISTVGDYLSYIDDFADCVSSLADGISQVGDMLDNAVGLVTGAIDKITNVVNEVINLQDTVLKTALKFTPQSIMTEVFNAAADLGQSFKDMKNWWGDFKEGTEWKKIKSNFKDSKNTMTDVFDDVFKGTEKSINKLIASMIKISGTNTIQPYVLPVSDYGNDQIIIANGYTEHSITDGETWASLSNEFYGTDEYATLLQLGNDDKEIVAGTKIFIPKLGSQNNDFSMNEIYSQPNEKDIYGYDINISDSQDFEFIGNDFNLVDGIKNLNQAIINRLSSSINSRVRNVVYGIRNETGVAASDVTAISSYVTSSIQQTLLMDPRIEEIEELEWESKSDDKLYIKIVYRTITGNQSSYYGTI